MKFPFSIFFFWFHLLSIVILYKMEFINKNQKYIQGVLFFFAYFEVL
jgi:hypothetical protein